MSDVYRRFRLIERDGRRRVVNMKARGRRFASHQTKYPNLWPTDVLRTKVYLALGRGESVDAVARMYRVKWELVYQMLEDMQ